MSLTFINVVTVNQGCKFFCGPLFVDYNEVAKTRICVEISAEIGHELMNFTQGCNCPLNHVL